MLALSTNNVQLCTSDATTHLPHAVGKQEAYVVTHLPDQRQRLLVLLLRLTTEPGDEVTAQTDP